MAFGVIPKGFDPIHIRLAFPSALRIIDADFDGTQSHPTHCSGATHRLAHAIRHISSFHDRQKSFPLCIRRGYLFTRERKTTMRAFKL
ncbi:MAG: hypothetical protein H0W49_07365 [Nitrospirales bacterium]|nr:hypothetical protein [Nitrospirales bacterium]MBA3965711.1 hypothetical protein [Nitrospirales bacterium]